MNENNIICITINIKFDDQLKWTEHKNHQIILTIHNLKMWEGEGGRREDGG